MLIALLIAGIGFLLAGLLGIAFGIPVKEFSFGNTEILAGVITACTGAIMLGLWMVVRELKEIAQALAFGAAVPRAASPQADAGSTPRDLAAENDGLPFSGSAVVHPAEAQAAAPPSAPPAPPPWHEETVTRDRVRGDTPPALPEASAEAAPAAAKPRRNLLFSSTSRRERERAEAAAPAKAGEPPATFEEAWPQPERARPPEALIRRSSRPPAAVAEAHAVPVADRPLPPVQNEDPPGVTMLKSGVVDGMAYSLYSDGSIEAQMPEGMMRFASIDELRTYLDQRG
jgi:hypothetical protein